MFVHRVLMMLTLCWWLGSTALAQTLAPKWEIPLPFHGAASIYLLTFDLKGDTFTGMVANFPIADGKINGNEIRFSITANGKPINFAIGKIYGDQMSILMEEAPGRPIPHPGLKHSWTAFRKIGNEPLDWVPDQVSPLPFTTSVAAKGGKANPVFTGRFEAPYAWGTKTCTYEFVFEAEGTSLKGKAAVLGTQEVFEIADGRINGNDVSFTWLKMGQPIARFTGTLHGDGGQLALLMEEIGSRRLPEAKGGKIHPMTGFRNDGTEPWYAWFPSLMERGKMGPYKTLAGVIHQIYQKGDIKTAATLATVLNHMWDSSETALLKRAPDTWAQIDHAMDGFILPLIRYQGGMPDPADIEKRYQEYLEKLKLGN